MKYSVNQTCTSAVLGNETVVLNAESGVYFSLNEVGGFLWQKLSEQAYSVEELTGAVLNQYDTDERTCAADVQEILDQLLREKLVTAG